MKPKSPLPFLLLFAAFPFAASAHEKDAPAPAAAPAAEHSHGTAAGKFSCPMHPEVVADRAGACPKCGMSLKAKTGAGHHAEPTIKATVTAAAPLEAGKLANVTLHLTKPDGNPMLLTDLEDAHTKKIHLLLNDQSLSDYHHEHPVPTKVPGDYQFSFTPLKPGPYRVWADLVPTANGAQEYTITDIPATTTGEPLTDREPATTAMVEGLKYEVTLDQPSLLVGQATMGKLTITKADGQPFDQLEPLMAAYAHIVGFGEDGKSIVHIHPMGAEPTAETDRGTGSLEFHIVPTQAGLMRLYAQVQIGGVSKYAKFTLMINEPAK